MMTKPVSLKILRKMPGFMDRDFPPQDESLKGDVDVAKRHVPVRKTQSSGATMVKEAVSEKNNRTERCSSDSGSEPVPEPEPEPEPITAHRIKLRVEQAEKEQRACGLRKYSCELAIDTNTVHRNLRLWDHDRKVTWVTEEQLYPHHPERFDVYLQLLCTPGLTGRCYWEVEWRGWVEVSVSYRRTSRKGNGDDCRFGFNAQSWTLECSEHVAGYSVRHDNRRTSFSSSRVSKRAAVFVDCPAGTLSFYEVSSDELIHIHTFYTTFTEPVYPGFGLLSSGSLVSPSLKQQQEPLCV